jgi:hypothetical protein
MAFKRSSGRSARGSKRGVAKVFFIVNLIVWGAIGGWYLFQPPERKEEVSRLVGNWVEGRKNVTAFEVAWDLWQIYGSEDFVAGGRGVLSENHSEMQALLYGGALPESQRKVVRVLGNAGYVVGYSEAMGNPLWAAYRSFDVKSLDAPKRPEDFRVDGRTVAVPEAFFMIVVDESEGRVRAQAFVFPQETGEGEALEKFVASIDEIEARTGLDFLSVLPDEAEAALEARRVGRVW